MLRTLTTTLLVAFTFALSTQVATAAVAVHTPEAAQEAPARQTTKPPTPAPASINLNTATAVELETLPGVGPATALRILEYREKNGAFKKIEDLMNVRGIGEKTFLTLKPLINVAPPKGLAW